MVWAWWAWFVGVGLKWLYKQGLWFVMKNNFILSLLSVTEVIFHSILFVVPLSLFSLFRVFKISSSSTFISYSLLMFVRLSSFLFPSPCVCDLSLLLRLCVPHYMCVWVVSFLEIKCSVAVHLNWGTTIFGGRHTAIHSDLKYISQSRWWCLDSWSKNFDYGFGDIVSLFINSVFCLIVCLIK